MNDLDRVEKLLALLLLQELKDKSEKVKAFHLSLAGFSQSEIADLLNTTPHVVRTHLYEVRKTRKPKLNKTNTKAQTNDSES